MSAERYRCARRVRRGFLTFSDLAVCASVMPGTADSPGTAKAGVALRLPPFFFSALVVARVSLTFLVTSLPVARLNVTGLAAAFLPSVTAKPTGSAAAGPLDRSVTFATLRLRSTAILRIFTLSENCWITGATGVTCGVEVVGVDVPVVLWALVDGISEPISLASPLIGQLGEVGSTHEVTVVP